MVPDVEETYLCAVVVGILGNDADVLALGSMAMHGIELPVARTAIEYQRELVSISLCLEGLNLPADEAPTVADNHHMSIKGSGKPPPVFVFNRSLDNPSAPDPNRAG